MVNSISGNSKAGQVYAWREKQDARTGEGKDAKEENSVIVEIGKSEEKSVTYGKGAQRKPNAEEVKRLWEETERATQALRSLVESLINRQGKKLEDILAGKEVLVVDEEARAEAERMISEDGEWGVKAVSGRIVAFAKAVSGGDKSRLEELKKAIGAGFDEAEKAFGGELPEISRKTYDEIMRQLEEWEKEE